MRLTHFLGSALLLAPPVSALTLRGLTVRGSNSAVANVTLTIDEFQVSQVQKVQGEAAENSQQDGQDQQASPWESKMLPLSLMVAAIFMGGCLFEVGGVLMPHLPPRALSLIVCAIYIAISVTIDLSIMIQKTGSKKMYDFNPLCAIILTELVKLVISVALYLVSQMRKGEPLMPSELMTSDAAWLSLPAMLFTANNILVFVAIGKNDVAAFGVFRDTVIVWTFAIWIVFFKKSLGDLGSLRVLAVLVVLAGLMLNRMGSISKGTLWSWSFLWVMTMTLANATGSVVNEFALKRNAALNINIQNALLYVMCALFSICLLVIHAPEALTMAGFFRGFTQQTAFMIGLQAFAGLMVSRLLKYADAPTKSVASCLRGPTLLFVSPLFTVSSSLDLLSAVSAVVVSSGCFIYLSQPPMQSDKATK